MSNTLEDSKTKDITSLESNPNCWVINHYNILHIVKYTMWVLLFSFIWEIVVVISIELYFSQWSLRRTPEELYTHNLKRLILVIPKEVDRGWYSLQSREVNTCASQGIWLVKYLKQIAWKNGRGINVCAEII